MSTEYSKAPRVRIPQDIQSGDILVLRDGQQKMFKGWDEDGDAWCDGSSIPSVFHQDGRWVGVEDGDFSTHRWDVVAIKRKTAQAVDGQTYKDAKYLAWLAERHPVILGPSQVSRIRAIAKRMNGGVAP